MSLLLSVFILPQIVLGLLFKNKESFDISKNLNIEKNVLGTSINLDKEKIVDLTNKERLVNNLDTLKFNKKLTKAAEEKLESMFAEGYWDHNSPSKRKPWNFILEQDYDYHYAGENLAKDFESEEELVKAWMDSSPHRANILNQNYKEIGIAVATGKLNGKQIILAVQMFGTEFGEEDYEKAGMLRETKVEQSFPIVTKKLTIKDISYSRLTAQTMIFASVMVLMFYMAYRFNQDSKKKGFGLVMKKYWAHFIFLFFLGVMMWIARDAKVI